MQKLVTFLIFVLIAALVVIVTIPQWAVKKPDKVLIGHLPDVPNCWFYFGLEQGLFEKYKLKPQVIEFSSYEEALDSLQNGKIDCFFSFPWSFLLKEMSHPLEEVSDSLEMTSDTLAAVGDTLEAMSDTSVETASDTVIQYKVIISFYSTPDLPYGALIVPQKSKVTSIKKLHKRKVGVLTYPYGELEILLNRALEEEISKKNVRVEVVEKTEIPSLLGNQEIACALLYEPNLTRVLGRDKTQVLTEDPVSTYLINPYPLQAACISVSFLTEEREAALNLRSALEESFEFGNLNEADMRSFLTDYMSLTTSESRRVRLPSFEKYEVINREAIQNFADLLANEGILPDTVETRGILFEMFE